MRALLALPLAAVLVLTSGCPSYSYRRAGTTPYFTPASRNGRAMSRLAEMSFATVGALEEPGPGEDDNAAIYVPNRHFNLQLRGSVFQGWDAGFIWDQGLGQSATRVAGDGEPDPGDDDPFGFGFTFYSAGNEKRGFNVGGEVQGLLYFVPYAVFRTCLEDCTSTTPQYGEYDGYAVVPVGMFTVIPSWRAGPLTVFASFALRNHISIERASEGGVDGGVNLGPFMVSAGAGVEVQVPPGVSLALQLFQPMSGSPIFGEAPVDYGPSAMFWLTIPFTHLEPKVKPPRKKPVDEELPPRPLPKRPTRPPGPQPHDPDSAPGPIR